MLGTPLFWRDIMTIINGKEIDASGKTISQYLMDANYTKARVAVELNGDIVSKSKYDEIVLQDGDTVEIVSFVGGG